MQRLLRMKYEYAFIIIIFCSTAFPINAQDTISKRTENIEYYKNGKIHSITHSVNGRWDGECIWNDTTGRLQSIENYVNGNKVGTTESYENGIIYFKGTYDEQARKKGEWTFYFNNGKIDKIYLYNADTIVKHFEVDANNKRYEIVHYKSISDAGKNPLLVYFLDLRSKGYQVFPKEILQFKNLKYLDLSAYDLNETDSAKKYFDSTFIYERSIPRHSSYDPYIPIAGAYKRNKISSVPKEIETLKSLRWIDLYETDLSRRQIRRLKKLLPKDCIIRSEWSEKD